MAAAAEVVLLVRVGVTGAPLLLIMPEGVWL
jgi:hypothetical protein